MKKMNKVLDSLFIDNKERTLSERAEMVKDGANSFKYIPQTVSVVTITIILIGLVSQFFGVEKGTDFYYVILAIGCVTGLILGFKLEKSIETFFCYPIQLLKEKEVKNNLAQFITTSFTCFLLIGLSLFLSLGGKKQAVSSSIEFTPTDITNDIHNVVNSFGMSNNNVISKVEKCQNSINDRYDKLINDSKKQAYRTKDIDNRNWLLVGNVKKLENKRGKELKQCSKNYEKEFKATETTASAAANVAIKLMQSDSLKNAIVKEQTELKAVSYDFYLGNIILLSLPLSLLLYIVKVLNEKK